MSQATSLWMFDFHPELNGGFSCEQPAVITDRVATGNVWAAAASASVDWVEKQP